MTGSVNTAVGKDAPPVLTHRVDGSGPGLLLLNGIAMSIASWEPVAARLSDTYQVIRCDFRGQLLSPGTPPADMADHAADVVRLLDHLGLERVHLVATSFGGGVAALVAARWPERVRSLVSVASACGFDGPMAAEVQRWRQACLKVLGGGDRGALSDVLEPVAYSADYLASHGDERRARRVQVAALPDSWYRSLVGLLDSTGPVDLRSELARIRCPTLVVAAGDDGFVPRDRARALADGVDGAIFAVVAGAGHAVVLEQPAELARLIRDFLPSGGPER